MQWSRKTIRVLLFVTQTKNYYTSQLCTIQVYLLSVAIPATCTTQRIIKTFWLHRAQGVKHIRIYIQSELQHISLVTIKYCTAWNITTQINNLHVQYTYIVKQITDSTWGFRKLYNTSNKYTRKKCTDFVSSSYLQ